MFANQTRGAVGLGSIGAVAAIMLASLVGTGVMAKAYSDGPASDLPADTTCQLICQGAAKG